MKILPFPIITTIPSAIADVLGQLKGYLQKTYPNELEKIILFGSQARGDARIDSDIDILIVLKYPFDYYQEVKKISQFVSILCLENNLLITCCFTTLEQWQTTQSSFYRNIYKEGISL